MMTYVLDFVLIALFVLCVWLGWSRGFIKTVSGLIALVAAVLLASMLSGPIAEGVYNGSVEPAVFSALEEHVSGEVLPTEEQLDTAIEKLPSFVTTLLAAGDMDSGAAILSKVEVVDAGKTAARTITDRVITPIVLPLMQMLCSVLIFLLVYIVASILLRVLDLVAKLPLLKQLNSFLGLLAGALTGAVWVIFVARILFTLAWLGIAEWLSPALLEQTWLVSFANSLIPTIEV